MLDEVRPRAGEQQGMLGRFDALCSRNLLDHVMGMQAASTCLLPARLLLLEHDRHA
jgi:hypothetical protein